MLGHSLAIRFMWTNAEVSFVQLRGHWLPLAAVFSAGALVLLLDGKALFSFAHFDRAALEVDLDKAESWLKSWAAPALRIMTFGFINPRRIVGVVVTRVLGEA